MSPREAVSTGGAEDLREILSAIREVEANLDRRAARASGVTMMAWGAAAASILLFYYFVQLSPERYVDALGLWGMRFAWVVPSALAYVVTALAGARLGRVSAAGARAAWPIRRLMLLLIAPFAVLAFAMFTGRGMEYMPAMWTAFLGGTHLSRCFQPARMQRVYVAAGVLSLLIAVYLVIDPSSVGNLVAAAWYMIALFGFGIVQYHARE